VAGNAHIHEDWGAARRARDGDGSGVQRRYPRAPYIVLGAATRGGGEDNRWAVVVGDLNGGRLQVVKRRDRCSSF
jgi:hypothetical protein